MKLINYTLFYLTAILFAIVTLWAILFYYQILNQLKASMDEGLANYKILLLDDLKNEAGSIQTDVNAGRNYTIKQIDDDYALQVRDTYKDTLVFSNIKNVHERARLLTTAFVNENGEFFEMKIISQELNRGKLIQKLATSLLWLYLFVLLSIVLVNNFVLKKTWQPFYQLLKSLKDFRLDGVSYAEPPQTKIKEFSILNETVQKLLKENVDAFSNQKHFIENMSHELQTPLAISLNQLELLADSKDLGDHHIQKIGNIIETLQHLANLNKSLLLISKIENKQFVLNETVDFDLIFKRIISDFTDYSEFREIEIKYTIEENWVQKMNKDLAEILVMNLVKNAIFHNHPKGKVIIKLWASEFTIENTSNEPALPTDKLFERFNKNQNKPGSTGLGLAIVKAIADASDLSVSYSFNHSGHHLIKVHS